MLANSSLQISYVSLRFAALYSTITIILITQFFFGLLVIFVNMFRSAVFRSNKIFTNKVRGYRWMADGVKAFLLDVYGVLYDGSSDVPITGSVEAVKKYVVLITDWTTNSSQTSQN